MKEKKVNLGAGLPFLWGDGRGRLGYLAGCFFFLGAVGEGPRDRFPHPCRPENSKPIKILFPGELDTAIRSGINSVSIMAFSVTDAGG